jgi:dihydroflavonol-4-reductase
VMCVSNTYGPRDWQPTPHGSLVAMAALGKMPAYINGVAAEVVGVEDAAEALLLAADRGRVGERYIVSERFMTAREIFDTAADAVGARRPRFGVPLRVFKLAGIVGDVVSRMLRRDVRINIVSVRLSHIMSPLDHTKAVRELGWQPSPTQDSIRKAARFCVERHRRHPGRTGLLPAGGGGRERPGNVDERGAPG